ncbi:PAS domain S-box protein [Novosphingobium sp. G106]|uniref:PAS domain S-box protein n=1 Tax=Novosphingobium sp. G106 TaxID=2849500 RepID=UPI001C2CEDDD|nr:PAS domain S-box protein [Novosphingobium sp. G106]MBV1690359.1 PAS domain S-box protein [Novosphingobium sp. G106]
MTFAHLEQLTAQLLDGIILIDTAGAILSANTAALRMHGVASVDELGATAEGYAERFTVFSADHRPLKRRDYPLFRLLAGDTFPDLVVEVAPAGESEARWVHQVRDVAMDDDGDEPDFLALVICDISERFDAEARFKAMFGANPAPAVIVRQSDLRLTQANAGFLSLTGFEADQLIGKTLFGIDLLQDVDHASEFRRRIEAGEVVPQTEARLLVADGSRRLVLFAGQPVDVTGEDALLLTFADLEPRRLAEAALAASEKNLAAIFDMAPIPMAVIGRGDGQIVNVNAAFSQLTQFTSDEAAGQTIDDLQLWARSEDRAAADREVEAQGRMRNADARLLTKDGQAVDCLASAEAIDRHGASLILWVFQDITERRRSELELVQAIDEVMKDASWLSRSIVDKLASLRRPGTSGSNADLSPREREILELICEDLDDAAIAARLDLSRNTVRNHVARLYAKIGVNRRSGAVVWGRERGVGGKIR